MTHLYQYCITNNKQIMLSTDLIRHIFKFCHTDFFDDILKSDDTILMNYLTDLGLHKVLLLRCGTKTTPCIRGYDDTCFNITRLYIAKYTFKPNLYHNDNTKQIVPYNQKTYRFDYVACCPHLNTTYDEKNLPLCYRCDFNKLLNLEEKYNQSVNNRKSDIPFEYLFDVMLMRNESPSDSNHFLHQYSAKEHKCMYCYIRKIFALPVFTN